MLATMKIYFSLTTEDYGEYQQTYLTRIAGFWQRYHFRVFVTFGIIVFVAGLNWIFFEHREDYPGWVSIAGGLYLVFSGAWAKLKWRRWFSRNAHLYQNLEVEITDGNLMVRSKTEETIAKWEHYSRLVESQNLFVLLDPHGNCLILPKRSFAPADLESFLQILHRKPDLLHAGMPRSTQGPG
jgi:YcxB-like protein